jgi:DNA-binding response OmpR family regulator
MTDVHLEVKTILNLRDKLAAAEARVEALQYLLDELTGDGLDLPDVGLRRTERRILGALMHTPGRRLTAEQLIAAYRADAPYADWPDPSTARVHIYNIRRKIAGTGIGITTHWRGDGYSATVEEPPKGDA